jgi:PAS domain S-box-containing protein
MPVPESPTSVPPLVFVVDDDQGLSRLLEKSLQREGFLTASAASFQEAVAWLAQHQPELMLLDLKLGDISGGELIDHLAAQGRTVPFVMITGQGDERVAVAMMKRGAIDYLVKDGDFLQFMPEVVRRALGRLERDRKLAVAEEALRRSEANLAKAQQIAHLGSYEFNVGSATLEYRSEEIYRILGLDSGSTAAWDAAYLESLVHPNDRSKYRQALGQALRDGAPFDLEYRVVRPDGSIRHVQSLGEPVVDSQGKVVKLVGTLLDITERKRAEEGLRREHAFSSAVLDTSAALVVVLDRHGRIVRFNRACEQTTGYSAAQVLGRPFWDWFLVPEEVEEVKAVFSRVRSGPFPTRHENYWRTRDGQKRLVAWSNSALLDEEGMVEYVISVGIDITERRRLEQEILQISELEQRRIGQDLHDGLCQHLAATELMSEILEQRLAKKSKADAARAAEVARQVREAISQTRLLARGLSPVVLESEGLMSALQELADSTERMFRVKCEFDCPGAVLVHNHTTATHLYRIAQEAVSNAIRHGKARRIVVSLSRADERLALEIRDDGIGLPPDLSKAKGMGLRIMQYRAGMSGGTLAIQNLPEGGARVACSVPFTAHGKEDDHHDHAQETEKNQPDSVHR